MFIGDSANLAFLRTIRGLVDASIGSCTFVNDPFREQMVESVPDGPTTWLENTAKQPPAKPDYNRAAYLIHRFALATNCVMDLFDERELLGTLPAWLESGSPQNEALSPIYFLVFALGAQTCPEEQDAVANLYFSYGRLLTASTLMEDPSIATLQACAMITMYLLGACRRNAAFMYLGTAVRAAYALGIHRADISALFPPAEFQTRERLWKVLRILDLFMSASLGRPPSTEETRDTECEDGYSATTDLCAIFEQILSDIYTKRMITTNTVQKISERHRRWTLRFYRGLAADKIVQDESIEGSLPNMGLIHLKEAYYWTIILLTRPFFVEYVSRRISSKSQSTGDGQATPDAHSTDQVLVHACVNSAICTVNLLKTLLTSKDIPKRLPFVVNSIFVSGLVLGLAYFGDLYKTYPLDDALNTVFKVLALFPKDAIARRNLAILDMLNEASNIYVKRRKDEAMARHAHLISGIFGQMDKTPHTGQNDGALHQDGTDPFNRPVGEASSHPPPEIFSLGVSNGTVVDMPNTGVTSGPGMTFSSATSPYQYDFSMLPSTSPRTLWFGSYEDNVPLFPTFDTRTFDM
jgi:hypothetical protein